MADPVKSKPTPAPEPAPVLPPQSPEAQAISERQRFTAENPGSKGVAILPGGQRIRVGNFAGARYALNKQGTLLGNPESILTDDWLAAHPGWKYNWPIGDSEETKMYLKGGQYKAVPPEAIRRDVDYAVVGDAITVQGSAVSWKRHILVAIPYAVWHEQNVSHADFALERTSTGQDFKAQLDDMFGGSGYQAEVTAFTDQRVERI